MKIRGRHYRLPIEGARPLNQNKQIPYIPNAAHLSEAIPEGGGLYLSHTYETDSKPSTATNKTLHHPEWLKVGRFGVSLVV